MPGTTARPLVECFTLGPFATNCYVVSVPPSTECWIVDAGFSPEPMIEHITQHELHPTRIILSHAHSDHIGGIPEVRQAFPGVPVSVHQAERAWLTDGELNLSAAFGLPLSVGDPDETLAGGEMFELGEARFDVLFTPGHSPGGITLHNAEAGVALVGDTLFADSIGRSDFPTSDGPALLRSIKEILYSLPDETAVHPGHGPSTTIGREKRGNPFVRGE